MIFLLSAVYLIILISLDDFGLRSVFIVRGILYQFFNNILYLSHDNIYFFIIVTIANVYLCSYSTRGFNYALLKSVYSGVSDLTNKKTYYKNIYNGARKFINSEYTTWAYQELLKEHRRLFGS